MNDTELYHQLLGLQAPWQVTDVNLDIAKEAVYIAVDFSPDATVSFVCPECGLPASRYDRREARTWRHLDTMQFKTYLVASLPRVECKQHGIQTVKASWCEPNSRFTLLFERFAIAVLQATKVQMKAAQLLRLTAGQIHDLMERSVARGLGRRGRNERLSHLSLDEKSFQRGHHYITVLGDPLGKRVLEVIQGRTLDATEELITTSLSQSQREAVLSVSMDMWPAFMGARAKALPKADTVHDRFHVAAYLNDAVDKTRRAENRQLTKEKDKTLSKSKYLWLKSDENLTDKQRTALEGLQSLELETAKVWAFKENFRQFFACTSLYGAQTFLQQWYEAACALGNTYLSRVARMLNDHKDGLLAYVRHKVNNASAESLNAQIQNIKTCARGYRKFESFRVAILFFLGKLDLNPHKSP
jgi:transposase